MILNLNGEWSETFLEVLKIFQGTEKRRFEQLVYVISGFLNLPLSVLSFSIVTITMYQSIVMVTIEDNTKLRVRVEKFTDDVDQFFEPSFFGSLEDLDDFEKRFRHSTFRFRMMIVVSISYNTCYGLRFSPFRPYDLRFYDVVVSSGSHFFLLLAFWYVCLFYIVFLLVVHVRILLLFPPKIFYVFFVC
jgi:hypothetical protein